AVVEAGLGGRYDATNVLPSRVAVLTNVGLEHTRWLGPTVADIAREKLAVLRPGTTLVVGAGLHPDAEREARAAAASAGARLLVAPADPGVPLGARGEFQRRNFALPRTAAEAYLGALDERAVRAAAAATPVPGRDLPRRRHAAPPGRGPRSHAVTEPDGPSVLPMIAIVAVIVAVVILVLFALGYVFGRLFL